MSEIITIIRKCDNVIMMTMITMSILMMTDERHLRCILCEFVLHTLIDQHDHL